MPRGQSFTLIEDEILLSAFTVYGRTEQCYNKIKEQALINSLSIRTFESYRRRFSIITTAITSTVANTTKNVLKNQRETNKAEFINNIISSCNNIDDLDVIINKCTEKKKELENKKKTLPDCPICLQKSCSQVVMSQCKHIFCIECFIKLQARKTKYGEDYLDCPICRAKWDEPLEIKLMKENVNIYECIISNNIF